MLDNLIDNAFLHASGGSRVRVGFERNGQAAKVFVDDDGPGVPEDLREQVFAKFFRVPGTIGKGTGLGLSIVQEIIRAHGGELGVHQSPIGGARFWFAMPARAGGADPDETGPLSAP